MTKIPLLDTPNYSVLIDEDIKEMFKDTVHMENSPLLAQLIKELKILNEKL